MPSYWPDNKPHKRAYRRPLSKMFYWLYLHVGLRSRFWVRVCSEHEASAFYGYFPANKSMGSLLTLKVATQSDI